jgi:hypothetical protein
MNNVVTKGVQFGVGLGGSIASYKALKYTTFYTTKMLLGQTRYEELIPTSRYKLILLDVLGSSMTSYYLGPIIKGVSNEIYNFIIHPLLREAYDWWNQESTIDWSAILYAIDKLLTDVLSFSIQTTFYTTKMLLGQTRYEELMISKYKIILLETLKEMCDLTVWNATSVITPTVWNATSVIIPTVWNATSVIIPTVWNATSVIIDPMLREAYDWYGQESTIEWSYYSSTLHSFTLSPTLYIIDNYLPYGLSLSIKKSLVIGTTKYICSSFSNNKVSDIIGFLATQASWPLLIVYSSEEPIVMILFNNFFDKKRINNFIINNNLFNKIIKLDVEKKDLVLDSISIYVKYYFYEFNASTNKEDFIATLVTPLFLALSDQERMIGEVLYSYINNILNKDILKDSLLADDKTGNNNCKYNIDKIINIINSIPNEINTPINEQYIENMTSLICPLFINNGKYYDNFICSFSSSSLYWLHKFLFIELNGILPIIKARSQELLRNIDNTHEIQKDIIVNDITEYIKSVESELNGIVSSYFDNLLHYINVGFFNDLQDNQITNVYNELINDQYMENFEVF